jgi:NAD(P)-dependent dehydrogenase (short-subunit alcohol dehydrogenase family)
MAIADVSSKSLPELLSLQGRKAVVTGGARGLGKAIGSRLAEAGAAVLLADRDEPAALSAASDLCKLHGDRVHATSVDVTSSHSIANLASEAVDRHGRIDIWINNAGIFPSTPLLEMPDEEWDRVLNTNLRGVFLGCREAARRMIAAGIPGVIVNVASVAGFRGIRAGVAHYVASKHGVRGLTSQLAVELGPHGIRVLGVAPTIIMTEGVRAVQSTVIAKGDPQGTGLLGRAGVPDDVARVVVFCASDLAIFMTGSTVPVDAGRLSLG